MLVMAHINLNLYNLHQPLASYPFSSTETSINVDADTDVLYVQGFTWYIHVLAMYKLFQKIENRKENKFFIAEGKSERAILTSQYTV